METVSSSRNEAWPWIIAGWSKLAAHPVWDPPCGMLASVASEPATRITSVTGQSNNWITHVDGLRARRTKALTAFKVFPSAVVRDCWAFETPQARSWRPFFAA